jgi:hypothetical protein
MADDPSAQVTTSVQLPSDTGADWSGLWVRTQRGCVMTLEITRILILDAIILGIGDCLIRVTAWIAGSDGFLAVAQKLSSGLFLLLYVLLAGFHIAEFVRANSRGAK